MTINRKQAFAERLKKALKRSAEQVDGATDLAHQFNLHHPHHSITVQAAHKWLSGQAIPSDEKIETLASWLNVSSYWLRMGEQELAPSDANLQAKQTEAEANPVDPQLQAEEDAKLLANLRRMRPYQRKLFMELAEQMVAEKEVWPTVR